MTADLLAGPREPSFTTRSAIDLMIQADALARLITAVRLDLKGELVPMNPAHFPEGVFIFSFARPLKGYERRSYLHRPELPEGFKRRTHSGAGLSFHVPNRPAAHWACIEAPSRQTPRDDQGQWIADATQLMRDRIAGPSEVGELLADLWSHGLLRAMELLEEQLSLFEKEGEDLRQMLSASASASRTSQRASFALRLGKLIALRSRAHLRADPTLLDDRLRLASRVQSDLIGGATTGGSVLKAYIWQVAHELRRIHRADPAIDRAAARFRALADTEAKALDIDADALMAFLTTTLRSQHRRPPLLHCHNTLFGHQRHEERPRHLRYPRRSPLSHRCRRDAIITALREGLPTETIPWPSGTLMWCLAMRKERYDPPTGRLASALGRLPQYEGRRVRAREVRAGIKAVLALVERLSGHLEACRLTLLEDLQIIGSDASSRV